MLAGMNLASLHIRLSVWVVAMACVSGQVCEVIRQEDKLDLLLANAMFEPSSCDSTGGGTTSFSSSINAGNPISDWDVVNAPYECDAFGVQMNHADVSDDRMWSMNLGIGGHIMSFIGPYGEAIANQAVAYASWNDLVTQPVAVSSPKHLTVQDGTTYPYFIHGSGPYTRDCVGIIGVNRTCDESVEGMPPPFYNPSVARECSSGDTCAAINWGNQAHLKTIFRSDVLYYSKYKDCGHGVMEYDIVIYNYSDEDTLTYLNTPWTAVRSSSLKDMMVATDADPPVLEHQYPLGSFGPTLRDLRTTGGFTTFAQSLELPSYDFEMPCIDPTLNAPTACSTAGAVSFQLQVIENNTATYSGYHANLLDGYAVRMTLCDQEAAIPTGAYNPHGLIFTNDNTGFQVEVSTVIHWCWLGEQAYFLSSVDETVLNQEFSAGDTITVTVKEDGLPTEDNVALTFVHGLGLENDAAENDWLNSRMRYGLTNERRDGTVWTTNFLGNVEPQETYYNRKYMITDRLTEMEARSQAFVDSTHEDVVSMAELPAGEEIRLLHSDTQFGAALVGEDCVTLQQACIGSSTPKADSKPLFYITCGGTTYVGSDTYALAPDDGTFYRPYLCDGEAVEVRPTYKLLGFFPDGDCAALESLTYEADLVTNGCPEPTSSPTTDTPTSSPTTDTPTSSPTTDTPTSSPTTDTPTSSTACDGQDSRIRVRFLPGETARRTFRCAFIRNPRRRGDYCDLIPDMVRYPGSRWENNDDLAPVSSFCQTQCSSECLGTRTLNALL